VLSSANLATLKYGSFLDIITASSFIHQDNEVKGAIEAALIKPNQCDSFKNSGSKRKWVMMMLVFCKKKPTEICGQN
jgi:hypothetical protein